MSELNITEVRVTFGNGIKKEEYGALKKAEVTITAIVPEGGDGQATLDVAGRLAVAKVAELLGVAAPAVAAAPSGGVADGAPAGAPSAPPARRRRTNAEIAADNAAAEAAKLAAEKPADVTEGFDPTPAEPETPTVTEAEAPADEWGSEPAAISDKDLTDACTKNAQRLAEAGDAQGTVKIRELIGTFNPDPTKKFSLVEIAAGSRADFLAKLGALGK